MSIQVRCGKCGSQFSVSSQRARARVKCKNCGRAVSVSQSRQNDQSDVAPSRTSSKATRKERPQRRPETWVIVTAGSGLFVLLLLLLWIAVPPVMNAINTSIAESSYQQAIQTLDTESDDDARKAMETLREYGADAAGALIRGIQTNRAPVRDRCLELLQELGQDAAPVASEVAPALTSKIFAIRRTALHALAAIGDELPELADAVRPLLTDEDPRIRAAALPAFIAVATATEAASAVTERLYDDDLAVKETACREAGRLDQNCLEMMTELLKLRDTLEPANSTDRVRIAMHQAFLACGSPSTAAMDAVAADAALPGSSEKLRLSAFQTLGQCGPDAVAYFEPALEDKRFMSFAVEGLGHLGEAARPLVPKLIVAVQQMDALEAEARLAEQASVLSNNSQRTTVRQTNARGEVLSERHYANSSIHGRETSSRTDELQMAPNVLQWHRGARIGREVLSSLGIDIETNSSESQPGNVDDPALQTPDSDPAAAAP